LQTGSYVTNRKIDSGALLTFLSSSNRSRLGRHFKSFRLKAYFDRFKTQNIGRQVARETENNVTICFPVLKFVQVVCAIVQKLFKCFNSDGRK
jgi:hypothetical protein